MKKMTDWIALWQELVEMNLTYGRHGQKIDDHWQERASSFNEAVKRRWGKPDSSREFVLSIINSEDTLLDIGAGSGAWEVLLAPRIKTTSAIEPSQSMRDIMRQNLLTARINNVKIIPGKWPEVEILPHTHTLCAHSMYGCADFERFIQRMVAATLQTCTLILRLPLPGSLMTQAAKKVFGHPHDSPNFVIAYNALLQMGIHANVIMENSGPWEPWVSSNFDEALKMIKEKLGLFNSSKHDDYLSGLLQENLVEQDGSLVWPAGIRSALIHWKTCDNR
jgi:SAM-dependent methyltransferase